MATETIEEPTTKAKSKQVSLTMDDLSRLIEEAVEKRMAGLKDGQEMAARSAQVPVYPYEPKEGAIIPPGYMAPEGWIQVPMRNGLIELHRKAPEGFSPLERRDVLSMVDKKWKELNRIVAGQPVPAEPKRILINERFREMFPNLIRWGDNCVVMDVADKDLGEDAIGDGKSKARFKFVL